MDILTVETLAETLQELNRPLLTQGLRTLGQDRCAAILADTLTDEASGGMLTRDGTRRRTPPGVFFQRVRERATPQERRRLFPHLARKRNRFLCSYSCLADTSRLLYPSCSVLELESETRLAILLILTLGGHSGFRVTGTGQVHIGDEVQTLA